MQWEDFFKALLNVNENRTSPQGNQSQKLKNNEDVPPTTRAEVDKAIQRLKKQKCKYGWHPCMLEHVLIGYYNIKS